MATSVEFIEFFCERLGSRDVRYKKMFGEYMVYVSGRPIFLVCNDTVYVKELPELEELMRDAERGIPYSGAKEHYILDAENETAVNAAADILERITPLPKQKAKKGK